MSQGSRLGQTPLGRRLLKLKLMVPEVNRPQLKRALAELVKQGVICLNGERNRARYTLATSGE